MRQGWGIAAAVACAFGLGLCSVPRHRVRSGPWPPLREQPRPLAVADTLVAAAREQVARGVRYDAEYVSLPYPGGDVDPGRGACTDVVIRALRQVGYDLQELVHEDMREHFALYPRRWGLRAPDASIDHRRVGNLTVFFRRHATSLPLEPKTAENYQPGDLVCLLLPGDRDHIGVASDRRDRGGAPLLIHNMGPVAREDDSLRQLRVVAHFRYPRSRPLPRSRLLPRSGSSNLTIKNASSPSK